MFVIAGGSVNVSVVDYDRQGWYVVLVALLVALVAGLWRSRTRGLFASMVMFGALALALITAALTAAHIPTFLFSTFDARAAKADDSWKAAQTIVLTLGFIGVVITGVLGYHRQRTAQDQLVLERRSRQHERYAKGSEMLAAEAPEMRIAGVNVIATLGSEVSMDDDLRQTCINLICAYLRKNSPASPQTERSIRMKDITRYRVVAEEASRLLPTLFAEVRETRIQRPKWWRRRRLFALNLDLRGAELISLNLSGCLIGVAQFSGCKFSGQATFIDTEVVEFATFDGAVFDEKASFGGSTVKVAVFSGATFSGEARFARARFEDSAGFDGVTFGGDADFDLVRFDDGALFSGATFSGEATFTWARIQHVGFEGVTFGGDADFSSGSFSVGALFSGATFSGKASFARTRFGKVGFDDVTFGGEAQFDRSGFEVGSFKRATFCEVVNFSGATFRRPPRFDGTRFRRYEGNADALGLDLAIPEIKSSLSGAEFGDGSPEDLMSGESG